MTISKKLLSISILASITTIMSAVSMEGFDSSALTRYIERAEDAFCSAHNMIQWIHHGPHEIIISGKYIAKDLYVAQKAILKYIKRYLKRIADSHKDGDLQTYCEQQQLYEAFTHWVYKPWKKRVKAQYQESKKSNDPHAWGWIHTRQELLIEKS